MGVDDPLDPWFLAATAQPLIAEGDYDVAFTDFQLFGDEGGVWRQRDPFGLPEMLRRQTIPGPGSVMRRSLWERVGGFCEAMELRSGNEDWDFWIAVAASGEIRALHVPELLYLYRRHAASMSSLTLSSRAYAQHEFIHARHRDLFRRHRAGAAFLAEGYVRSAKADLRAGHRLRAIAVLLRLALRPKVARQVVARVAH